MGGRNKSDRAEFGLERNRCTIEQRPCGTHPGTEHGTMCGSLMLGMVPGMFGRLRLRQSTNGKEAEYQEDRQELEDAV
ncbi:MAG TPA: hypothetical protein VLM19_08985, partial [Nitrospiraceae bacterium]|nr:hypothetical protein [Nitrospiraceae bacterium]